MSTKHFCDVCKIELKKWSTVEIGSAGMMSYERERYDLCHAHARAFDKLKREFFAAKNGKRWRD